MTTFSHYENCPKCNALGRDSRGDNLGVYSDGSKHCFSCSYHVFSNVNNHNAFRKEVDDTPKDLLPFDFTREVPNAALKWLLLYGLPWSYWKNSLGWSEAHSRLVFTVGNPTKFSIGRYIQSGEEVKRKWRVWGESHKEAHEVGHGEKVVVVEDWISANKIATTDSISLCLFGTTFHPCHIKYLQEKNLPVYLWLDYDQRHTMPLRAMSLQSLINTPVQFICTEQDPKNLSQQQIVDKLS